MSPLLQGGSDAPAEPSPFPPQIQIPGTEQPEPEKCNAPFFSLDAALFNANRRTTGLVLGEGGFPPVQQTLASGGVGNVMCQDADLELSVWYSLHDASDIIETRIRGRVIVEVMPRVRVYGGIARYRNPEGLFSRESIFFLAGSEYPSFWGTTVNADYLRDYKENGDWLTLTISKRHRLGTVKGAVFNYRQGLGATATRKLPTNPQTSDLTGLPSAFYRAILEIEDGPVTWYFEASPHVSFVSRATGVRKHHVLVAAGLQFELR